MLEPMTTTRRPNVEAAPRPPAPPDGPFAILSIPHYRSLWLSSWTWNISRWLGFFTASYLVYEQSGSTLLVQLVGTAFFAPMFIGGLAGGVIADRFDRRRVLIGQFWFLVALAIVLSIDVASGAVHAWHIYLAMLLLGVGAVSDVTCRRPLIADTAGPEFVRSAFAMEAMSNTGGTLLGNLLGGIAISVAGAGAAFAIIGLLCAIGAYAQFRVPAQRALAKHVRPEVRRELLEGLRFTAKSPALLSVLSVTVVMNTFFYTYSPLVPVFAKHIGVNAFWAGVLGSAAGLGSLTSAFLIAGRYVRLAGVKLYVGGTALGLVALAAFALCRFYPLALVALIVAGTGAAGFSTMQSALVVTTAPAALRGRMMGIVSMAIGVLPFAMLALGLVAQRTGPVIALAASCIAGLGVLAAVWSAGRSMRRLDERSVAGRRDQPPA
jgi:MFS family permease